MSGRITLETEDDVERELKAIGESDGLWLSARTEVHDDGQQLLVLN